MRENELLKSLVSRRGKLGALTRKRNVQSLLDDDEKEADHVDWHEPK